MLGFFFSSFNPLSLLLATVPFLLRRLRVALLLASLVAALPLARVSQARAERVRVVIDTEVAHTLALLAQPLLPALGDATERLTLHVLWNKQVNAFVSAGTHVVVFSGLIRASENAEELQAVLAHEFGHVLADHYALTVSERERAQRVALLLMFASLPLAAVSGEAAIAAAIGLPQAVINLTLAEQRARETVADNSALLILERASLTPRGMVTFLQKLGGERAAGYAKYLQTHPATSARVAFLEERVSRSPFLSNSPDAKKRLAFVRLKAKLDAYALPPALVLNKYAREKFSHNSNDNGNGNADRALAAGLARAIAFHRQQDTKRALREVASLLRRKPADPFFFELKGDILRADTFGKPFEGERRAQAAYRKALTLLSAQHARNDSFGVDLPVRLSLFDSLLATDALEEAAAVMEEGLAKSPRSILARRKLARLYDRQGRHAERALVWAEALWLGGERNKAYCNAQEAIRQLPPDSPQRLRAEDLTLQLRTHKKRGDRFACS